MTAQLEWTRTYAKGPLQSGVNPELAPRFDSKTAVLREINSMPKFALTKKASVDIWVRPKGGLEAEWELSRSIGIKNIKKALETASIVPSVVLKARVAQSSALSPEKERGGVKKAIVLPA